MMRLLSVTAMFAFTALLRTAAADMALLPGAPLTAQVVADLVRDELAARGIAGQLAVEVRQPAAALPNRAGTAMHIVLAELRHDRRTGGFLGRIEAYLPSGEATATAIAGRVDELVETLVPLRPLPRGDTIAIEDLDSAWLLMASLPGDALRRAEDLVGRQAARALAAGRAVRAGEIAAPWAVKRGDEASMSFNRGGLQIVTAAEILENGRPGQSVRVRNAVSGEVRQAVVIGPRRVEVRGVAP
jgi:flagella basal body P-ring formation protein FlgA